MPLKSHVQGVGLVAYGVSEALLTIAAGLAIGIPALTLYYVEDLACQQYRAQIFVLAFGDQHA
jgi:biopolymer transport protein ExbB/TolQ